MKAFNFLHFWIKHPSFKDVVNENCHAYFEANPFTMFNYKLKKLKKDLSTLRKATYEDIFQKIVSLDEVILVHEAQFKLYHT